jgi:hypothetical protein
MYHNNSVTAIQRHINSTVDAGLYNNKITMPGYIVPIFGSGITEGKP